MTCHLGQMLCFTMGYMPICVVCVSAVVRKSRFCPSPPLARSVRGSREGWASAFWPRLMNRSFFGLLRPSLLRPSLLPPSSAPASFGNNGPRRGRWASGAPQRTLGRPARSRPATGDVTTTDRYLLLRVVCGPSVAKKGLRANCRSTCRSSALPR